MTEWNQFGLQNAFSPMMEEFILFHDYLMIILIYIMASVFIFMMNFFTSKWVYSNLLMNQMLEFFWTIIPVFFLLMVAIPSLLLLYSADMSHSCSITLKVMGHQWYWSYEYSDFWMANQMEFLNFDAYMVSSDVLEKGMFRLLETDNRPSLPFLTSVRVLISSADVLHSWAVPSLGVKLDATPGRLNQTSLMSYQPGVNYGQCSEICGANHSFMPISIEFLSMEDFIEWTENQ